jgi:hypothetical protein
VHFSDKNCLKKIKKTFAGFFWYNFQGIIFYKKNLLKSLIDCKSSNGIFLFFSSSSPHSQPPIPSSCHNIDFFRPTSNPGNVLIGAVPFAVEDGLVQEIGLRDPVVAFMKPNAELDGQDGRLRGDSVMLETDKWGKY